MKKVFMSIMAILMAFSFVLGSFGGIEVKAASTEEAIEVTIHYHRYDDAYDGWNLWLWPYGGNGAAYQFDEGTDDFGKSITVSLEAGHPDQLGIIVRLNEWEKKDVEADRFIDLSRAKDGKLEVFLIQEQSEILYSAEAADISPKFLSASIDALGRVIVSVSTDMGEADTDTFRITDETGAVIGITDITVGGTNTDAIITVGDKMSISHTYTISNDTFGRMNIGISGLFGTEDFAEEFTYSGNDLGMTYTKELTLLRLWAPTADTVSVNVYASGNGDDLIENIPMTRAEAGTWTATLSGDRAGQYYTYVCSFGDVVNESCDPYARTTGVNGYRAMILDLDSTDPSGWEEDQGPALASYTDAVLYELHVRDLSSDENSGIVNKGKYLGFTEKGTKNSDGLSTGLDHIKDLGVTHIHLLPVYDYASVDETAENPDFNWGYDPQNYNVPEGSYSTDPYNGEVRVNEFKQMVQAIHSEGIGVVMDVVYNHTFNTTTHPFALTVPQYYYRMQGEMYSNGSGCGNEVASERSMVRKYIVDSVCYWATEYHVDGFRFDLMGLIDIDTMNEISAKLHEINPNIIIYGEGWTGGTSLLDSNKAALKANAYMLDGVAVFSDDMRDGLKGSVFSEKDKGFVSGKETVKERIKFGITGGIKAEQIDFSKVGSVYTYWAGAPTQAINYASCHDNNTLWDKLSISARLFSKEQRVAMNKLSAAIVLSSQGIPFFQAGEEFLRSKPDAYTVSGYSSNSYNRDDSVNSIRWSARTENADVYEYYRGLISFRKAHPALRLTTTKDVNYYLRFTETDSEQLIAYTIKAGIEDKDLYVVLNAAEDAAEVVLPEGIWDVYVDGTGAGTEILTSVEGAVKVDGISATILVKSDKSSLEPEVTEAPAKEEEKLTANTEAADNSETTAGQITDTSEETEEKSNKGLYMTLGAAALAGLTLAIINERKKKQGKK